MKATTILQTLLNVKDAELIELGGGHPSLICRTSKLPEGWIPITFLSLGLVVCLCLGYYVYFNFHEFHFHLSRQSILNLHGFYLSSLYIFCGKSVTDDKMNLISRAYASLGHAHAQHLVGERMLHGAGTAKDEVPFCNVLGKKVGQSHFHPDFKSDT